jgi:hypothetical protein
MTDEQRLWWSQAKSDHGAFTLLRKQGAAECHLLHYLQMATEKLAKAYLWRSGMAPPASHVGFSRFLRALMTRSSPDLRRIARVFDFGRPVEMEAWVRQVGPLAHELQNLAPVVANDGPNPEYPWPHKSPIECPVEFSFPLWPQLRDERRGRELLKFIRNGVERFEQFALVA